MLTVALAAACVDIFLIWYKSAALDWAGYIAILAVVSGLFALGAFYRLSGRSDRIGAAAFCAAAFIFYSLCMSLFSYLLLPIVGPTWDLELNAIDKVLGYHWPDVINWASQNPIANQVLLIAYMSTIPQFAALVVLLGLSGKIKKLQALLLSVTLTATFTICFWGVFPTMGTTVLFQIPPSIEKLTAPFADTAYGKEMLLMAQQGPGLISPKEIKGLVAFPSYHIVLAVVAIYYAYSIKWLFPVYLVLNLLIMPAIFVHGGHHFVDLPAGMIVALAGIWLANRTMNQRFERQGIPEFAAQ